METDFVQKYGAINVEYITGPPKSVLFTKPFALNYFHQGKLYRTAGERSSGKLELFLDLLYVGIVSSIAEPLVEHCNGSALLRYFILFVPVFTVWYDITSMMNYYYNDDLTQRLFLLWITVLLMIYANNTSYVLDSHKATAMCVVPYILCRVSVAASSLFYSQFIPEHRTQLRLYAFLIIITSPIWICVIFIGTRAKIGVSIFLVIWEQVCLTTSSHPRIKKLLNVSHGTLLNIEHFVERFASFYIIAIGEFLFTIVSGHPTGEGISVKMWKLIMILMIAYIFMWLYFNGDCSNTLVHALRRSLTTATAWIYIHVPLIASLILTADAAATLLELDEIDLVNEYEEELSLYGLSFFFTTGILIALLCLSVLALCDKPLGQENVFGLSQLYRVLPRIPALIIIVCLSFAEMKPARLIGLSTLILSLLFVYEVFVIMRVGVKDEPVALEVSTQNSAKIQDGRLIEDPLQDSSQGSRIATL